MNQTPAVDTGRADRAVSPVIGIILMVAITVILAAVIGAFALGLGDTREPTPQASFSGAVVDDGGNADLTITHEGGDPIHSDRTRVIVEMVESNGGGDPAGDRDVVEPASTDQVLTAGSTTTYEISNNDWTGAWSARDPATVQGFTDPDPGDVVRLTIVDTETNGIVYEREYEVQ